MRVPQVVELFIEVFKMSSHDRTLQPTVKTLVFSNITCLTKDRTDDMKLGGRTIWQIQSTVSQECRSEDFFVCCCKFQFAVLVALGVTSGSTDSRSLYRCGDLETMRVCGAVS